MFYIDVRYLRQISGRFRNFSQKNENLWNCSCTICGDSSTNLTRARLYFFKADNALLCKCHNCQFSAPFSKLLQMIDPALHKQYCLDHYVSKYRIKPTIQIDESAAFERFGSNPLERFKNASELSIQSIADLPPNHYAKVYINSRLIPEHCHNLIYYTDDYKGFMDKDFPNHGKKELSNDARIIIPFVNRDGYVTHITGRSLAADPSIRYITVKLIDSVKIFGINRLDFNDQVYIVEGPFDSLFLPNAVAAGDSNLIGVAEELVKEYAVDKWNIVLLYDFEPRNQALVNSMEKAIGLGYKIVIWDAPGKDINDLVRAKRKLYHDVLDQHIFQGLEAMLRFSEWRKC